MQTSCIVLSYHYFVCNIKPSEIISKTRYFFQNSEENLRNKKIVRYLLYSDNNLEQNVLSFKNIFVASLL